MATETFKILGQSQPSATTNTTAYTVPAKTQAVVSTIAICNTNAAARTIRVYIVPSGGSAATSNALYYGLDIAAYDTFAATFGVTLAASDFVVVYTSGADVTFQIFGSEVSA